MSYPKRENLHKTKRQFLTIVGSRNPVKINSTDAAFHQCFEDSFIVQGINVTSDVAEQPVGDQETLQGAMNRAENARNAFPEADYWLGIEGGVDEDSHGMHAFAWVVVLDKEKKVGKAKTSTFYLPEAISKLVKGGLELGKADDSFFSRENSKETDGAVGILTNGAVNRKSYYEQAIILALVPFMNSNIY